jgi:tetratricopeptide (TPR) repeat protein
VSGMAGKEEGLTRPVRYGLELLHHAPELLADDARLLALPPSFPWNAGVVDASLEPLQLLLRAEASYYAGHAEAAERTEALESALQLLERARQLRPGHLQVELRRAAVLSRLGRRSEAIRALVAQQKETPGAARLYWRVGTLLAQDENTIRTALVTIHGSTRFGVAGSRLYFPRLVSLARRCVLLLWGSGALGSRAGFLPNGVLQMVLDKMPIWDVLRMSCVCFSWATFASQESYWRSRLARDWTKEHWQHLSAVSSKEKYRLVMHKNSTRVWAEG